MRGEKNAEWHAAKFPKTFCNNLKLQVVDLTSKQVLDILHMKLNASLQKRTHAAPTITNSVSKRNIMQRRCKTCGLSSRGATWLFLTRGAAKTDAVMGGSVLSERRPLRGEGRWRHRAWEAHGKRWGSRRKEKVISRGGWGAKVNWEVQGQEMLVCWWGQTLSNEFSLVIQYYQTQKVRCKDKHP